MNSWLISLVAAGIVAFIVNNYNTSKQQTPGFKPINVVYAAGAAAALTYLVLYSMRDPKSEVLNEIEVGDPDF